MPIAMPSSSPLPFPVFSQLFFSFLLSQLTQSLSPISAATSNLSHPSSSSTLTLLHLAQNTCIPEHLSALLQLKRRFDFSDSSTNLSSWNANHKETCCSWEGITCNASTGHVIGLNLTGCFIAGVLDFKILFHLRSLEKLDLASNNFDGSPIPSGFAQLSNLTHLHLSGCNFYGQIPLDIFQLFRLVSLDLSFNEYYKDYDGKYLRLQLESPAACEQLLQNLSSLRELRLDYTNMSALGNQWSKILAHALPDTLRMLSMRHCGLLGPFHPSFSRLSFLTDLDLSYNNISSHVPQFIANFTSLTSLSLHGSAFCGEFPQSIFSLPKLRLLGISENPILTIFLPKFCANRTIQQLYISGTKLHGNLANFLNHFPSLTDLDLSSCNISGPIPQSLVNLTQLTYLSLSNNNFQGPIPSLIFELMHLQSLYLGSNNLSGVIDLGMFQNFKNLETLDLSCNSLTVVNEARSNSTSTSFPQLMFLRLQSCNISKFPEALRNQQAMWWLDLSYNRITGKIPQWIWAVGSGGLGYLNLSHNALEGLEGPFPHPSLTSMLCLDLSANKLKGSILIPPPSSLIFSLANNTLHGEVPSHICEAKNLAVLDLSSNQLTGAIPKCLGEISDVMYVLNLKKNAFRGPLLQAFKPGCKLHTLDLSENQLEGKMPKSLANCQHLTVLNLENNHMRDEFPSQLTNLSNLRILKLRSNQFYGSIGTPSRSESRALFPLLQIFDVSFNNLSGRLPSDLFSAWKMMKDAGSASPFPIEVLFGGSFVERLFYGGYYCQDGVSLAIKGLELEYVKVLAAPTAIDLSHNQFHGDIPSSIGELHSLRVLNMSHNHFQGQILASIANLKQLESLDLSQNNLSGKIPQPLSKLSFLVVGNFSQNHLSGSIPRDFQFNTFQNDSFLGNPRLCGPPLSKDCQEDVVLPPPPLLLRRSKKQYKREVDFIWMGFAAGHSVGFGVFIWTMALWRKGRHAFFKFFDKASALATALFPSKKL